MRLAYAWLLATAILLVVSFFAPKARAEGVRTSTLHILSLDSEDADEQAEALSVALRARARAKLTWTVADSSPSLGMFLAALRCPPNPDAACLQKISDQLKTDRFIYGRVHRLGPTARGQLSAEIHLYVRGKPDVSVKEVFSDNLKDQNDDYLRRMASRIIDRLAGTSPQTATVTVHAGRAEGAIWVDGSESAPLRKGQGKLELGPGRHVIEVRVAGQGPVRKDVTVAGGSNLDLTLAGASDDEPSPTPSVHQEPSRGTNTRSIVGWGLIGVGAIAGGFGIYEGVHFLQLRSDTDKFRDENQVRGQGPNKEAICQAGQQPATWNKSGEGAARDICDNYDAAKTASLLGVIGGGVALAAIGTGAYLLLTDTSAKRDGRDERSAASRTKKASSKLAKDGQTRPNVQFLPYFEPRAQQMNVGFDVRVVF